MDKKNVKKIVIISVIFIIIIAGIGLGIYKYNKVQAYNKLITTANKDMDLGKYDEAITLFQESLKYKKDSSIEKNIKLATSLEKFKKIYNDGAKLENDKKYLEAIEKFKMIDKSGLKWYNNAQKKIEECKKQYISQNLESANNAFNNNSYDDANKYLDDILKIDSNNKDAKNLKTSIDKIVKEQNEKAEVEEQSKQTTNNSVNGNIEKVNTQNNDKMNTVHSYYNKVDEIDEQIDNLHNQEKFYPDGSNEKLNIMRQEIELMKQRNQILSEANQFIQQMQK